MKSHVKESRLFWLGCGVIGGLCVAYFWPHEQAYASATDRDAKFAICTVETGPQLPEAVFVLDFTTGRLQGGMLNAQAGVFANRWYANVGQDFKAKGGGGKYTMIPGSGFLMPNANGGGGGVIPGLGMIYIGELTSGMVGCYRFYYRNQVGDATPMELEPVASFNFREAASK